MHSIKNKTLKHAIKSILIMLLTFTSMHLPALVNADQIQPSGGYYNLSAKHTYSDLYASIIFSNGSEGSASSANLGYNQIAKYPSNSSTDGVTSTDDRYGVLIADPNTFNNETIKLTRLLSTYREYSWLVSKPSETDGSIVDRGMALISNFVFDKVEDFSLSFVLNNAVFGANIYEMSDGFIITFEKFMLNLDIPTAFRLRNSLSSNQLGQTQSLFVTNKQADQMTSKGLIHQVIDGLLSALNVDARFWQLIQNIFWTFLIFGSLIMIMNSIRKAQMGQALTVINRLLVRMIVVIMSIEGTAMIQPIINSLSSTLSNSFTSTLDFSKSIVFDSLLWAGTQNLSMSELGKVQGGSSEADVTKPIESMKPTFDNVNALNNKSIRIAAEANIDEYTQSSNQSANRSATRFMSALVQQKVFSVNEYFKLINNLDDNVSNVAASNYVGFDGSNIIRAGSNYVIDDSEYRNVTGTAVFMQERADSDKLTESEKDKIKTAILYQNQASSDKSGVEESNIASQFRYLTTGSVSWGGAKNTAFRRGAELILPYSEITPFSYKFVKWNDVESYIYGATSNNSSSTADYNNYIMGSNSLQNRNPVDASDDFSNIEEIGKDGNDSKTPYAQKIMNSNALMIALNNRYNGITGPSSDEKSLSTQSVAFILQSRLKKEGIEYYGYNTSYSRSDKGTPKQGDGVTYVRYVIPSLNKNDLIMKASMLGLVWIVTGISALAALFYLLKAPVFASLLKMTTSFFSAFFTGNLSALLEYLAYYSAISFSFAFARMGIYVTSSFASYIVINLPTWLQYVLTGSTSSIGDSAATLGTAASSLSNSLFDTTYAVPSLSVIAFSILIGIMMVWPIAEMRLGARNSKPRRVGLIGFIIMIPYMLAESFEEYLDAIHYKLYGKSKRQTFGSKLSNQFNMVDQGQVLREGGAKALKTAAGAGIAALTGGTSAALMSVGKSALAGVASKLAGGLSDALDENGNPIDEKGNVVEELGRDKSMFDAEESQEKPMSRMGRFLSSITTEPVSNAISSAGDKLESVGNWLNEEQSISEGTNEEIAAEASRRAENAKLKKAYENGEISDEEFELRDRNLSEDEIKIEKLRKQERLSERLTGDKSSLTDIYQSNQIRKAKETQDEYHEDDRDEEQIVERRSRSVNDDYDSQLAAEEHLRKYGNDYVEIENGRITKLYDDHPDNENYKQTESALNKLQQLLEKEAIARGMKQQSGDQPQTTERNDDQQRQQSISREIIRDDSQQHLSDQEIVKDNAQQQKVEQEIVGNNSNQQKVESDQSNTRQLNVDKAIVKDETPQRNVESDQSNTRQLNVDKAIVKDETQQTTSNQSSIDQNILAKLLESSQKQESALNAIGRNLSTTQRQVSQPVEKVEKVVENNTIQQPQQSQQSQQQQQSDSSAINKIAELRIDPKFMNNADAQKAMNAYDRAIAQLQAATNKVEIARRVANNDPNNETYRNAIIQVQNARENVKQSQQQVIAQAAPQTGTQNLIDGIKAAINNRTNVDAIQSTVNAKRSEGRRLEEELKLLRGSGMADSHPQVESRQLRVDKLQSELDGLTSALEKARRNLSIKEKVDKGIDLTKSVASQGREALADMSMLANGRDHIMTKALKGELSNKQGSSSDAKSAAQEETNRRLEEMTRTLEEANRLREAQMNEAFYRK